MIIGVMSKATSETVYSYTYTRFKTFADYPIEHFHQYEIVEGTDAKAYSFNGYQESFDDSWTEPSISAELYVKTVFADALVFGQKLMADFAEENMLMGITQMGKTADVLGIMSEQVLLAGSVKPISILDTVSTASLYELVKLVDHHISVMDEYAELSPFITADRLNAMKSDIIEFLS